MSKRLLRLIVIAAVIGAAAYFGRGFFDPATPLVSVVKAEIGTVEATITNSRAGTIRARRRARLSPEVGGTVVSLPFREGDTVEAGDIVLTLDDRLPRARLVVSQRDSEVATAERERSCLAADRATRELDRARQLTDDGIVSADRLDSLESAALGARAACTAASASERRAKSVVALSRAELSKMSIRAPFDGIVAKLSIEVGEYSTPSPPAVPVPPVIDLLDRSSIYVSAPMDEVDAAMIEPGLEAIISVDSHRNQEIHGRVVRVAPYVEDVQQQNRTLEIEVELDDAELAARLLPGTSADVEVVLDRHFEVLRIPAPVLAGDSRLIVVENGVLAEREIDIGLSNWDWVEVLEGVDQDSLIVTSTDLETFASGTPVRVDEGKPEG